MAAIAFETNGHTNGMSSYHATMIDQAKQVTEAYQLPRDAQESIRLNTQHNFLRDLNDGVLVHPSIPTDHITAVADVACGTGVWLMDYASRLARNDNPKLVGFDVSSAQFPSPQNRTGRDIDFVAHDMTTPFPKEYHNFFSLVNIRLVVAAVPVKDLQKTLVNILSILKPGGHLQWFDTSASSIWSNPFNTAAQAFILRICEEKAARGLSSCFAQDVLTSMLNLTTPLPTNAASIELEDGPMNLATKSRCPYTLLSYDEKPTCKQPNPEVRVAGHKALSAAYKSMLRKVAVDARMAAERLGLGDEERIELLWNAQHNERVMKAVEEQEAIGAFQWQWSLTWIVVQKAVYVERGQDWLNAGHDC